jgi:hypothetical protein
MVQPVVESQTALPEADRREAESEERGEGGKQSLVVEDQLEDRNETTEGLAVLIWLTAGKRLTSWQQVSRRCHEIGRRQISLIQDHL